MKAPFPADEDARLDALREYRVLDTVPEAEYDGLTRIASHICETPIALITLIDQDRQWFKSAVGMEVGETSRDVAFCAHAILEPELVVVPDARADPRFADNPFVTEPPHVRFYAGAPLVTPAGHALGTLCVIDDHPRDLAPEQRDALRALARQVVVQLELRRHVHELEAAVVERERVERELRQRSEQSARYSAVLMELAKADDPDLGPALQRITRADADTLGVARVGVWLFGDEGAELVCQDLYRRELERHEQGTTLRADNLPQYFRALRERRVIAARDALADPATLEFAADYLEPLGISSMLDVPIWRNGKMVGVVCHEHTGAPRAWTLDEQEFAASIADLAAQALEVAERKGAEEARRVSESRFRTMFEQFPFSIQIFARDGRTLEVNRAWERLFRMTPEQIRNFNPLTDPDLGPVRELLQRGFAGEEVNVPPHPFVPPPQREGEDPGEPVWLQVAVRPAREGAAIREVIVVHQDVTEKTRAEQQLRASETRYRALVEASTQAVWTAEGENGWDWDTTAWWLATTGQTREEAEGWGWLDALHPDDRDAAKEKWERALRTQEPYRNEYRVRTREGDYLHFAARGVPIREDGAVREWVGTFTDISELKTSEAALQRANDELERRVEERTAELAVVNEALEEEVAEHEAAREELVERTRELEAIFHALPDLYFRLERDGRIVDYRAGADWALSAPPSEFIGKRMQEVLPPEVGEQVQDAFDEVRRTGALCCIEYVLPLNGALRSFEARIVPLSDGEMISVVRDITDRRQAEEALRLQKTLLEAQGEASIDGILFVSNEGKMQSFNRRFVEMWEIPAEVVEQKSDEIALRHVLDKLRDPEEFLARVAYLYEHRVEESRDEIFLRDGRVFDRYSAPVMSHNCDYCGRIWFFRDITDRKQAEATLRESEEHFRRLIENASDMVQLLDHTGRIAYTGPSISHLLGYTPEEIAGSDAMSYIHPEDLSHTAAALADMLAHPGEVRTTQYRVRHKDGHYCSFEASARTLSPDSAAAGVVINARDVTERREAEEALRRAKRAAEEANQAKSEFLSRMSHELRTPMNSILGFAQLLAKKDLPADQRRGVDHILKAGQHLLSLINEVLDLARIEAGRQQLSLEPVRVATTLREAVGLVRPLAAQRGIEIVEPTDACDEIYARADRQRLAQVFLNLLSNAVKYNREGGRVVLTCEVHRSDAGDERVQVRVEDTGPGVRADRRDQLFVPFARLGAEQSGVEGTGLGLALSQRLTQAMGGALELERSTGEGSVFRVELRRVRSPLESYESNQGSTAFPESAAAHPARLLYIEDNLANLSLIETILLSRPEWEMTSAMQGRRGLELAREHLPDLILLDLHLPDTSGEEVLRKLREDERTSKVPVVIISADATHGSIGRLLAAGANAYLTKPIDIDEFLGTVDRLLRDNRDGPE